MQSIDDYLSTEEITSNEKTYLLREVLFGLREEYAANKALLKQLGADVVIDHKVAEKIDFSVSNYRIVSKITYKQSMIERFMSSLASSLGINQKNEESLKKNKEGLYTIPQENAIWFYVPKDFSEKVEEVYDKFDSMTYFGDKKEGIRLIITPSKVKITCEVNGANGKTIYTIEYDGNNDLVQIKTSNGKFKRNILDSILDSKVSLPSDVFANKIKVEKNGLSSKKFSIASRGTDKTGTYEIEDNGYSLHLKRHYL